MVSEQANDNVLGTRGVHLTCGQFGQSFCGPDLDSHTRKFPRRVPDTCIILQNMCC